MSVVQLVRPTSTELLRIIPNPQRLATPPLMRSQPYAYDALEPHIDAATMKVHHSGHHQTYTDKLNAALVELTGLAPALAALPLEQLLQRLPEVPEKVRGAVRNNGGGYVNHQCELSAAHPRAMAPRT